MRATPELRPVERRMVRLARDGLGADEIGRRFRRSPSHVERVLGWASLPGRRARPAPGLLNPLERRLLRWREDGADLEDLSYRFRRGPDHLARVLSYADLKRERFGHPG